MRKLIHAYTIGSFISELMIRNKIDQDQIVEDEVDLLRLLNRTIKNNNKPYKKNLDELFFQLEFDIYTHSPHEISDNSQIQDTKLEEIFFMIENGEIELAKQSALILENDPMFKKGIRFQILSNAKAKVSILRDEPLSTTLGIIEKALLLSDESFSITSFDVQLYMPQEIDLLHTLAKAYFEKGEITDAKIVLEVCKDSLSKVPFDYAEKNHTYIEVLLELATCLLHLQNYKSAKELIKEGYTYSVDLCNSYLASDLLSLQALVQEQSGFRSLATESAQMAYLGKVALGYKNPGKWISRFNFNTYQVESLNLQVVSSKPFVRGNIPVTDHMGELIRAFRKEKKLTQAQLSKGIYSQSNYNKIENGLIEAGVFQKESLFERLGRYPYYYTYNMLSADDRIVYEIKKKINRYISADDSKSALRLLEQIENEKHFTQGIGRQYVLQCKFTCDASMSEDEKAISMLEALNITIPHFDINRITSYHISIDEIKLINNLAGCYYEQGDFFKVSHICKQLLDNIDQNYVDEYAISSIYVMLLFNFCDAIIELGMYDNVISYSTRGWESAIRYRKYSYLKCFSLTLAKALFHTGQIDQSKAYIALSYQLAKIDKSELYMAISQDFSLNKLGLNVKK